MEAVVVLLLSVTVFCVELIIEFEGAWWEGRNWRMMLGYFSESHEGHIKNLYHDDWGFPGGASGKGPTCQYRTQRFNPQVGKIPLEEGKAPHSSILAWRIPWTEKPGGLWSIGLQRVRHSWSDLACMPMHGWFTCLRHQGDLY